MSDTMSKYDDIINQPRPALHHERMSMENRAAQFAPFSALNTLSEAIAETSRLTTPQSDMSDDDLSRLSRRLMIAIHYHRPVTITYFRPDPLKSGGSYLSASGHIKKIDETDHTLLLLGLDPIPLRLITDIRLD